MSEPPVLDLEAYKHRIGLKCELTPTLGTLNDLAEHHPKTIPFENLNVLLGLGIDLDIQSLEQKLVFERRGGYCFEQNGYMLEVLRQIGFEVTPLAGRVRMGVGRDFLPPRTHLFLSVTIDQEEWIFDAGVGAYSLTSPIRRHTSDEQSTRHEKRRLTSEDGKYYHQVWNGESWIDVYEFTGETMHEIDREVGNWWTSTSPRAKFSQNLMCAGALDNGQRQGILNDRYVRRFGAEVLEEIPLTSADQLLDILAERFDIHLPRGTRFGIGAKPWPTS